MRAVIILASLSQTRSKTKITWHRYAVNSLDWICFSISLLACVYKGIRHLPCVHNDARELISKIVSVDCCSGTLLSQPDTYWVSSSDLAAQCSLDSQLSAAFQHAYHDFASKSSIHSAPQHMQLAGTCYQSLLFVFENLSIVDVGGRLSLFVFAIMQLSLLVNMLSLCVLANVTVFSHM